MKHTKGRGYYSWISFICGGGQTPLGVDCIFDFCGVYCTTYTSTASLDAAAAATIVIIVAKSFQSEAQISKM